jgi:hypothetical protein
VGQEPEQLEQQIADTRVRLAETVDAIGQKLDVRARARGYVSEKRQAVVWSSRNGAATARDIAADPGVRRRAALAAAVAVAVVALAVFSLRRRRG